MKKKEQIRDYIIKIAGEIFSKYGYKKTTMNDIAEAVEKGKSSIYYYFKSKEVIFQAVVLQEAKIFRRTIINAINAKNTPYDKLKAYVLTRMKIVNKLTNFHEATEDKKLRYLKFIDRLNKLYAVEEVRLFKNILIEGRDEGFFETYDVDLAAIAIVTAMRGMESDFLTKPNDSNLEKKIDGIINIILYGIIKR